MHITNQIHNHTLSSDNTLHVVGMVSNPVRFHSRYRLFRQWLSEMKNTPNIKVHIAEIAYGDHQFEVTNPDDPTHLQLRSNEVLWQKENALNLAVKHLLPTDWKYVSWCDADITFLDPHWAQKTLNQLQHFHLVQPWTDCMDQGPHGETLQHFQSFCSLIRRGCKIQTHPTQPYKYAHTGFCWASTREFWENTQGLMDWCIVGSADHHQAWAAINKVSSSVHGMMSPGFKRAADDWQRRAYGLTKGRLGFVQGTILHHFHGKKANRKYRERWEMFIEHKYDPFVDLAYDAQGLVTLKSKPALNHEIFEYMLGRNEDSVDTY